MNPRICMTHCFTLVLLALFSHSSYGATPEGAAHPSKRQQSAMSSIDLPPSLQALTLGGPVQSPKKQKLDTEKERKREREQDEKTSMALLPPMQMLAFMNRLNNSYQYIANDFFGIHVIGSDSSKEFPLVLKCTVSTTKPTKILYCPKHWQPEEILIPYLKTLYCEKRGEKAPDSSLYVVDHEYFNSELPYCKLAPKITTETLSLFATLSGGGIEQAFPGTENISVAEKNSSIILAPGIAPRNLCQLWTSLYLYLKSLPVLRDNTLLEDLGASHEREQLKKVVNGYEKHQKVIEGIGRDTAGFIQLLFFEGGTSAKCVEHAQGREKQGYKTELLPLLPF